MVSSNISSVLYFDTLENISDNDNANYKVDHEGKPDIKAVIDIIKPDLPPLFEYDLESDSEDEQMMENVEKYFKTEDLNVSEITNSRVSADASAQAKVISDNSLITKSEKATIDITVEKVSLEVLGHGVDNKEATAVLPELRFVQSNVHQRQFLVHQISKDSDSTVKDIKPYDDSSIKKSKKKRKKKLEMTRPGAILPDDIWLSNHTIGYSMSTKEYNSQCKTLRNNCKLTNKCKAHTSLKNLQIITNKLRKVLSQSDNISTDWDKEKKIHSGKYGYLDTATNFGGNRDHQTIG